MNYLLSVVIPTKDRYIYLKECISSLMTLGSDELEIVIQDNTAQNYEIVSFLNIINSKNIKYFHQVGNLSQTENSDLAVSHATGKYLCYIGDDDSVAEGIIDITRFLDRNDILACVNNVATYHWPDVIYEGKKKPTLSFDTSNFQIKELTSPKILITCLTNGMQDIKFLPRIYHGVIAKSVLDKVKDITGTYFPGPSPDMANAVACALLIHKYLYIRLPLIISGYSFKSAGGMGLRGAHKGSLKAAKQLSPDVEINWDLLIPKVWLGYTMWAESALKSLSSMNDTKYCKRMNYYALYAKTFLRYREYRKLVFEHVHGISGIIRLFYECYKFMLRFSGSKLTLMSRYLTGKQYVSYKELTLQEASKITNNFIKSTDFIKILNVYEKRI